MELLRRLLSIGPGAMVAAAFIGPGTVVTSISVGGDFGYELLWAVAFSTIACVVLQEMTARLGTCGQMGLGEAIRVKIEVPSLRLAAATLVITAIFVGNVAYESGNITGVGLGGKVILPTQDWSSGWMIYSLYFAVFAIAFSLLFFQKQKLIERFLIALVCVMGLAFLVSAVLLKPDLSKIFSGVFLPSFPENSLPKVLALIGTTVVPYNLFLHASTAKKKWTSAESYRDAQLDTVVSIIAGGLITGAIVVVAASVLEGHDGKSNIDTFSTLLQDQMGRPTIILLGLGLIAAGLSSAITAPLAAAFALSEVLGIKDEKSLWFRGAWASVLVVGMFFACIGTKPTQLIILAQVANGMLLPIVAVFLVWIMNDDKILGRHRNGWFSNVVAIAFVGVTMVLGVQKIVTQLFP
ncbi:MAG: Nramp family divalent metal transporter [Planctomycetota bacterium]